MSERTLTEQARVLGGTVSVREVLAFLDTDRYLDLKEAAEYLSLSVRMIRALLPGIPHFRIGSKKLLFRKSELDGWMLQYREGGNAELDKLVDETLEGVLG